MKWKLLYWRFTRVTYKSIYFTHFRPLIELLLNLIYSLIYYLESLMISD